MLFMDKLSLESKAEIPAERKEKIKALERKLVENQLQRLRLELEESEIRDEIIEIEAIDNPIKAVARATVKSARDFGRYLIH